MKPRRRLSLAALALTAPAVTYATGLNEFCIDHLWCQIALFVTLLVAAVALLVLGAQP